MNLQYVRYWYDMFGLPGRILIGVAFAIAFGFLFKETGATDKTWIKALNLPGVLWLRLLKMVVVPLVFSNMVTSVVSIKRTTNGSRLGSAVVFYFVLTTLLAATEGLVVSALILIPSIKPIDEGSLPTVVDDAFTKKTSSLSVERDVWDQFQAILEGFTPTNVMSSAASGDLLGIISFSILFALALPSLEANGGRSTTIELLQEVNAVMFNIIEGLIVFSPIGVFSLVCEKVILFDIAEIIGFIGIFLGTVCVGLAFHNFVTYPTIYAICTRQNPFSYMKGVIPAMFTALGTSSSASTLPVTIQCAVETNGVPLDLAKFVLSLGATVNMDGTAIGFPVAIIFLAYSQGITLSFGKIITTAVVSTLSAMGAAPIPSAGLVLLITIMESVNVPVNALFGLIIAVDWIYDRPETMTNIVGDSFAAGIMAHFFADTTIIPEDGCKDVEAPCPVEEMIKE